MSFGSSTRSPDGAVRYLAAWDDEGRQQKRLSLARDNSDQPPALIGRESRVAGGLLHESQRRFQLLRVLLEALAI